MNDPALARRTEAIPVVLFGFHDGQVERLAARSARMASGFQAIDDPSDLVATLKGSPAHVVCLGPDCAGTVAAELLQRLRDSGGLAGSRVLVLAAGQDLELFQEFIDEDDLYFLSPAPPSVEDTAQLIESALRPEGAAPDAAVPDGLLVSLLRDLGRERELAGAARALARAVHQATGADRAWCYIVDSAQQTLWTPQTGSAGARQESAAVGIVGFVARTGVRVVLDEVGADPRYEPEVDNDNGATDERFVATPIEIHRPESDRVAAVLVAVRSPRRRPFAVEEIEVVDRIAHDSAPFLGRFLAEVAYEEAAAQATVRRSQIFRREALREYTSAESRSRLLELSPRWAQWTYRCLIAGLVAAALFVSLGSVSEYATGTAMIRTGAGVEVRAHAGGTVHSVHRESGQEVEGGAEIASLYSAEERARVEQLTREFENALVRRLRDPEDRRAEADLVALREQLLGAKALLDERSIRAPVAGVLRELRVFAGQNVRPGDLVATLVEPAESAARPRVVAILPARHHPTLEPGMFVRLELDGYPGAYPTLEIERVGDAGVGPAEAQRILGRDIGDALPLAGAVVVVEGTLNEATFMSGGREYRYNDRMIARAEVRLDRERILFALLPGLEGLRLRGREP